MMSLLRKWPEIFAKLHANETFCRRFNVFVWCCFLAITVAAYFPGTSVKGTDQVSIAGSMITISSILFGVIGAWLALMKIDAETQMRKLAKERESMSPVIERMGSLSDVITASSVVLFVCLAQVFAYYALSKISFVQPYAPYLKGGSFSVLVFLGLIQVKLILQILWIGLENFVDISKLERELLEENR